MLSKLISAALCLSAAMLSTSASASVISYNTTGSKLLCNGVAGCVANTSSSVTVGGLTFTYNSAVGAGILSPSIINLGNIVATGTDNAVNITGLELLIDINDLTTGASGFLPTGNISGSISTNISGATITFSPNNTTTTFGTLPGEVLSGNGFADTYQILNQLLGIQSPTVGNPIGQTSIQGAVTQGTASVTVPEPESLALLGIGMLAAVGAARRRRTRAS